MNMDYALKIDRLCKTYPHFALQNVTIDIPRGSVVGVVGENGAGKSTLMNVLSGVYPHGTYDGDIIVNGEVCSFKNIKRSTQ